ncbi:MAG: HNH endonuclease [Nitrospirae bacterium]|uniref:HNH endonuclease n=1 Tax=Candidatus Magnetobacterium casense TaxID=1455061 RepID=UPI0006979576|nr:HNH endonuclease signature motif containing protein [Candidatus Magnetobacterium casensis]MBF0337342.1 HNH endonuclease [Nitrospirota bacterium]
MVNVKKSQIAPDCLEIEKIKPNGDYKCGEVIKKVAEEFKNKCYICEYKGPTGINVEHFIPHEGNKDLMFDWKNLFYACWHCNNTKTNKYKNILNCTDSKHDVLNWIQYEIKPYPKEKPKITALKNEDEVKETVELLNAVYTGTTKLKKKEAENIRESLIEEMVIFGKLLFDYFKYDKDNETYKKIEWHLSSSSAFTAFKHWIVKDNEELRNEFNKLLSP